MLLETHRRHGRLGFRGSALLAVLATALPVAAWAAAEALPERATLVVAASATPHRWSSRAR